MIYIYIYKVVIHIMVMLGAVLYSAEATYITYEHMYINILENIPISRLFISQRNTIN